ncbi:MAG: hypothetical protein ACE5F7_05465 [Nitrospiria bacterium]
MINQILAVSLGVPAVYLFLGLVALLFFKNLRAELTTFFNDVTRELVAFMRRGIPIPMDYKRIDTPFIGEPVLTQAEARIQRRVRVAR